MSAAEVSNAKTTTMAANEARIDELESQIAQLAASNGQLEADVKDLEEEIAENQKAVAIAKTVRAKEMGRVQSILGGRRDRGRRVRYRVQGHKARRHGHRRENVASARFARELPPRGRSHAHVPHELF